MNSLIFTLKINELLTEIEKGIRADGGYLEVYEIKNKKITIALGGACEHCPSLQMTIKYGIEKRLQEEVDPEIEVINIKGASRF